MRTSIKICINNNPPTVFVLFIHFITKQFNNWNQPRVFTWFVMTKTLSEDKKKHLWIDWLLFQSVVFFYWIGKRYKPIILYSVQVKQWWSVHHNRNQCQWRASCITLNLQIWADLHDNYTNAKRNLLKYKKKWKSRQHSFQIVK